MGTTLNAMIRSIVEPTMLKETALGGSGGLRDVLDEAASTRRYTFSHGTSGEGVADVLMHDRFQLGSGAALTIDLSDLPSPFGDDQDLTAGRVKLLRIVVDEGYDGLLIVEPDDTDGWTGLLTGGELSLPAGSELLAVNKGNVAFEAGADSHRLLFRDDGSGLVGGAFDVIVIGSTG